MKERFQLTKIDNGRYIVHDNETGFTIMFKAGDYNASQKVLPPMGQPDDPTEAAKTAAYAMRCLGDYMAKEHPDLIHPTEEQERRRRHFVETTADIGRSLRELREYKGYSVEDAARLSGFTARRIENIEAGKLPADLNVITRIVERLGGRLAVVPEESSNDPHCQFIEFDA